MAYRNYTLLDSAARTTSDASDSLATVGDTFNAVLNVTAASGTSPTLDVELEWSMDGTTWVSASTPDTFTQATGSGTELVSFTVKAPLVRASYTLGGTSPSFTFDILGYTTFS